MSVQSELPIPSILDRHICTAADPYDPTRHWKGRHPDAREVGEQENGWPGGDIVTYQCPNCGITFKMELPQ